MNKRNIADPSQRRSCVFVGPTIVNTNSFPDFTFFSPARLGSVFRAVEAGFDTICIVDGYFGNTPAVWHKEILFAIDKGAAIYGAASTGALRAAELSQFGMIGIGSIYRLFRRGSLSDDDEVCIIHGPSELRFVPLSEPMINVRFTVRRIRRRRLITIEGEREVVKTVKAAHFSERTTSNVIAKLREVLGGTLCNQAEEVFHNHYVDAKQRDAAQMLNAARNNLAPRQHADWVFPRTQHWIEQFEDDIDDVPYLSDS